MTHYPNCKYCGAYHGMGIEEMSTGKITPLDICKECLWKPYHDSYKPIENQVVLENEMSEVLEKLEQRLLS